MDMLQKSSATINELKATAEEALMNAPAELHIDVTLTGVAASRFYFMKEIIKTFTKRSDQEITEYLVQGGAERELERFAFMGDAIRQQ